MITLIQAPTPNEAWMESVVRLLDQGATVPSRNGTTKELHPSVLHIENPAGRLVTAYGRPVNPAFALAEVISILRGQETVEHLKHYNSAIDQFSDDGLHFNAAYGQRIRYGDLVGDQFERMIEGLRHDPESRQAVMTIWDPMRDRAGDVGRYGSPREFSPHTTKDRACNLVSNALIRDGKLDWVQHMRSNDVMWGTPNNFMQWMHIQEWVANELGYPVGTYTHFANSLHLYEPHWSEASKVGYFDLYEVLNWQHQPMVTSADMRMPRTLTNAEADCAAGVMPPVNGLGDYWTAVMYIFRSWQEWKQHNNRGAAAWLEQCSDPVLRFAQARYYYWWRWHKLDRTPEVRTWMEFLKGSAPADVEDMIWDWVMAGHAEN